MERHLWVRFPEVIDEFQSRFPKITLDLRAKSSKEIVKDVRMGVLMSPLWKE